ncbi:MAG: hypothetical protein CMJ34_06840 [Phycisphaerae bacterium]|nr:hypothetical protein [Phycisphaerae bacterium]
MIAAGELKSFNLGIKHQLVTADEFFKRDVDQCVPPLQAKIAIVGDSVVVAIIEFSTQKITHIQHAIAIAVWYAVGEVTFVRHAIGVTIFA